MPENATLFIVGDVDEDLTVKQDPAAVLKKSLKKALAVSPETATGSWF